MAVQIKIPGVNFSDADDLPVVRVDPIMPTEGALVLIDPTHAANPWAAGVPAHGASVPNLAWQQAAELVGGSEASLAASIYNVGLSGAAGKVERTAKGGLHAIISPTYSFSDTTVGFNVAVPLAIRDYMRANPSHQFYASIWQRPTRAANTSFTTLFSTINADSTFGATFTPTTSLGGKSDGNNGSITDLRSAIDDTVGAPRFRNLASTPGAPFAGDTITNTPAQSPGTTSIFLVGNRHNVNGTSSSGARRGQGGSRAFYRYYLEDLTVSGRTYSQVTALDEGLFAALMNTPGGRLNGDTIPTAPSTIP